MLLPEEDGKQLVLHGVANSAGTKKAETADLSKLANKAVTSKTNLGNSTTTASPHFEINFSGGPSIELAQPMWEACQAALIVEANHRDQKGRPSKVLSHSAYCSKRIHWVACFPSHRPL